MKKMCDTCKECVNDLAFPRQTPSPPLLMAHSFLSIHWCDVSSYVYPVSHSHRKLPTVFMQVPCWHIPTKTTSIEYKAYLNSLSKF